MDDKLKAIDVVNWLNSLLSLDRHCIEYLTSHYALCENDKLANNSDVMVGVIAGKMQVGAIGIINGLVKDGYVARELDDKGRLVKFILIEE